MIKSINKKLENNELTVEVVCEVRKFAAHAIKVLTTEELIGILKKEYKIVSTKTSPSHKVGNSRRSKVRPSGTWVFLIQKETKSKSRRKTQTQKKDIPAALTTSTDSGPKNIRNRMSSLSKK
jgi:hypothetical protein